VVLWKLQTSTKCWGYFSNGKRYALILTKMGWATFFTNYLICSHCTRVARWLIFKPKIPIWVNFGGSCIRRCWHILWPFG
jgi:hypothetical protein